MKKAQKDELWKELEEFTIFHGRLPNLKSNALRGGDVLRHNPLTYITMLGKGDSDKVIDGLVRRMKLKLGEDGEWIIPTTKTAKAQVDVPNNETNGGGIDVVGNETIREPENADEEIVAATGEVELGDVARPEKEPVRAEETIEEPKRQKRKYTRHKKIDNEAETVAVATDVIFYEKTIGAELQGKDLSSNSAVVSNGVWKLGGIEIIYQIDSDGNETVEVKYQSKKCVREMETLTTGESRIKIRTNQ